MDMLYWCGDRSFSKPFFLGLEHAFWSKGQFLVISWLITLFAILPVGFRVLPHLFLPTRVHVHCWSGRYVRICCARPMSRSSRDTKSRLCIAGKKTELLLE